MKRNPRGLRRGLRTKRNSGWLVGDPWSYFASIFFGYFVVYSLFLQSRTQKKKRICKCGSSKHLNTYHRSCPLSRSYRPECGELGFRGSGRGPNRAAIAAAMKEKNIEIYEDCSEEDDFLQKCKRSSAKNKVELLERLRSFQVSCMSASCVYL